MSFSSQIKDELIKITDMPECCLRAMAYGMLLFGRSFNSSAISLMTDNEAVAKKYVDVVEKSTGVKVGMNVSEAGKYTLDVTDEMQRKEILNFFSLTGKERTLRIDRGNLLNESDSEDENLNCCNAAFLKGAFLSCGTASDPNKSYHIEFVVPFKTLSMDLMKVLTDYGFKAKHMVRRYVNVIYIKDSESIEDLLAVMGAHTSCLEIMNIKIYKDLRNRTNRINNFETANISRTVMASFDQIMAIEKIIQSGSFDSLPDDFKQVAKLRMENDDLSLKQIGEMCFPPMSRSAVNHRLKKLIEIADKLDKPTEEEN